MYKKKYEGLKRKVTICRTNYRFAEKTQTYGHDVSQGFPA